MDAPRRGRTFFGTRVVALAVGALVVDLAIRVLPLYDGSSSLSLAVHGPLRLQMANLLLLFAEAVVILVGLELLRRGRAAMASGVFVGLLVVLGFQVLSLALRIGRGWPWQTYLVLGLQAIECVLLFLAAFSARDTLPTRSPT